MYCLLYTSSDRTSAVLLGPPSVSYVPAAEASPAVNTPFALHLNCRARYRCGQCCIVPQSASAFHLCRKCCEWHPRRQWQRCIVQPRHTTLRCPALQAHRAHIPGRPIQRAVQSGACPLLAACPAAFQPGSLQGLTCLTRGMCGSGITCMQAAHVQ